MSLVTGSSTVIGQSVLQALTSAEFHSLFTAGQFYLHSLHRQHAHSFHHKGRHSRPVGLSPSCCRIWRQRYCRLRKETCCKYTQRQLIFASHLIAIRVLSLRMQARSSELQSPKSSWRSAKLPMSLVLGIAKKTNLAAGLTNASPITPRVRLQRKTPRPQPHPMQTALQLPPSPAIGTRSGESRVWTNSNYC